MAWYLILLVTIFHLSFKYTSAQDPFGYQLPETVLPSKYVVDLKIPDTVFTGANVTFEGEVTISFRLTSSASEIQLHTRSTITQTVLSSNIQAIPISDRTYNETTEILTLTLATSLSVATDYTLNILYTGSLETQTMRGSYISTYKDESNNTAYMVTTQFQPIHARHAFPCFDEPRYKATFVISLTYPSTLTALSNTPSETNTTVDTTYTKTTFQETPIMSTYLVAFIVSAFTCTEGDTIAAGIPHRVCSRSEEEADRTWAVEIGPPIMRSLESMTGLKYGSQMAKMDQIAIPDFSAGAMENWGLVTYRETGLLWNEEDTSNNYKKSIALVIAHEFTHMWFGNLVTCLSWDYTFLNEGFARFYQYFAADMTKQLSNWELDKMFNVEQLHTALLADSTVGAIALTSEAITPSQISGKFGTISYNKGASIYRMIETNLMGTDNFLYGIKNYLTTYSSQGAIPENLWSSLAPYVPSVALPNSVNLSTVLNNWVELSGHPVVTVTKSGINVVLSQNRFLLSGSDDTTQYYVPITYTTSSDISKFSNTTVKVWLAPGQTITLNGVLSGSDWIIVNNRQSGFYRVNYDSTLWAAIKSTLRSNHLSIDVLNRAQIVSDAYNFARAGANGGTVSHGYADVLSVLNYLQHETDYYPWYAAIIGNNHLLQRIGHDSTEGLQFISWMLKLLQNVYATVPFDVLDNSDQVYTMKQIMILTRVCKYGEQTCISKSKELFASYKNTGTKVPKNLRTIVYCNALRHSDDIESDFNFLWQKYGETKLMSEILTILSGLGCAENSTLLKWYLGQSINETSGIRYQDFTSVWSYVYTSSKIGAVAAMEYIRENYDELNSYYGSVDSLISNIANYFYSEDQLQSLQALINATGISESHITIAENALNTSRSNILWATSLKQEIKAYIDSETLTDTDGVAISRSSLMLVLVLFFIQKFVICLM